MAEYALIKDGEVKAVIVADEDFITTAAAAAAAQFGHADGRWILTSEKIGIGYRYDGANFAEPASAP